MLRASTLPFLVAALALAALRCTSPDASAANHAQKASAMDFDPAAADTAVFAMGCFWCAETAFEGMPGVGAVTSGFTGGRVANPSYDRVTRGGTGHYEAVEVVFDPRRVSYETLLRVFWHNVDPLDAGGQFCDRGDLYRAAIFPRNTAQRRLAEASKRALAGRFDRPVVTEILPAAPFYPAEDYHQDFWRKDPERYHSYRVGCRRDVRLDQLWDARARIAGDAL